MLKLYGAVISTSLDKLRYTMYTQSINRAPLSSVFERHQRSNFTRHGIPETSVSDNGYASKEFALSADHFGSAHWHPTCCSGHGKHKNSSVDRMVVVDVSLCHILSTWLFAGPSTDEQAIEDVKPWISNCSSTPNVKPGDGNDSTTSIG